MTTAERIGYSNYGDIILRQNGEHIELIRYHPLDYQYMDEYIQDSVDIHAEWQDAVWNGATDDGYEVRRDNYDYQYDDYFSYCADMDEYYDENDSDANWDNFYVSSFTKEQVVSQVMDVFNSDYQEGNFERASYDERQLADLIGEYYDACKEIIKQREEARKPHWNVFNYYK